MLFGRSRRTNPGRQGIPSRQAIIEFWQWWPTVQARLAASLDAPDGGASSAAEITQRVAAIHPDLDWELGAGQAARYDLTVSPGGRSDLRATAARWLALAPPADETWEFHDARQAIPTVSGLTVEFDGLNLSLGDVRFGLTRHDHSIDVAVFHPSFAELPELAEQPLMRLAFLCLDWVLGEQAVETWIGEISATRTTPTPADTVDGLRRAVADLAAHHQEPQWVILCGGPAQTQDLMAMAQVPLRPARWPRFDTHVALTLPYEDRGNGLPTDAALALLRQFEDDLAPILGQDGELLAHESGRECASCITTWTVSRACRSS
jgi:hypothetical protein